MKIKNIIWDWNGTIVDDAWLFVDIMNVFLKKHNLPTTSIKDYKNTFVFPVKNYWKRLGFKLTKEEFEKTNTLFINLYTKKMFNALLHSKIDFVLNRLKELGFVQFVLSASEKSLLKKGVSFYGLNHCFVSCWGVENVHASGKVDLAKRFVSSTKINPSETLLIGDTLYDLEVANFCGFRCLLVEYGHFNKRRLINKHPSVVSDPLEILDFIFKHYKTT